MAKRHKPTHAPPESHTSHETRGFSSAINKHYTPPQTFSSSSPVTSVSDTEFFEESIPTYEPVTATADHFYFEGSPATQANNRAPFTPFSIDLPRFEGSPATQATQRPPRSFEGSPATQATQRPPRPFESSPATQAFMREATYSTDHDGNITGYTFSDPTGTLTSEHTTTDSYGSSGSTWRGHIDTSFNRPTRSLADGLVVAPEIKRIPRESLLLKNPVVAENRRNCWKCKKPIARNTHNTEASLTGHCPYCQAEYRFIPTLQPGQIVADQYAVLGAFAYGGLGWLYLAVDKNVSDRIVVLKGMLTAHSGEAQAIASAERKFLAEVDHPGIVRIFNFVEDSTGTDLNHGYIVMEFFPGKTLHQVQRDHYEATHSKGLPIELAIGYVVDVLPALSYLHALGLVYNDLKPENIMASDEGTKLIDLGSVSTINAYGRIYGTPGFQAPDIVQEGPYPQSDVYTVGRTLASLILGSQLHKTYPHSLPTPEEEPIFEKYDSLYRLLLRATAPKAKDRFESAEELRIELLGVLREVLSIKTQRPHAALSKFFHPIRENFGINEILIDLPQIFQGEALDEHFTARDAFATLPHTLLDYRDPAFSMLSSTLSQNDPNLILESLRTIEINDPKIPEISAEFHYAMIRTLLDAKGVESAKTTMQHIPDALKNHWKYYWLSGLCALLSHKYRDAYYYFFTVYEKLPGEIAPRLAAGISAELYTRELQSTQRKTSPTIIVHSKKKSLFNFLHKAEPTLPQLPVFTFDGDKESFTKWTQRAAKMYKAVWTIDHGQISTALGYARMETQIGNTNNAVNLLDSVPLTSRFYLVARASAAMLLIYNRDISDVTEDELRHASVRIQALPDTDTNKSYLKALLFLEALTWILNHEDTGTPTSGPLLGFEFSEFGMRLAAEQAFRQLAKTAPQFTRYYLVDLANTIRPRTLF